MWVALGLSIAGVALLATLAIFWAVFWTRRSRAAREELRVSQQALASLHEAVAELQRQVDRQDRQLATRPDAALVITSLGSEQAGLEPGPIALRPTITERLASGTESGLARFLSRQADGPRALRRIVDRGAVRVVSLGFGVAHALRPEARDRIEFASRAGMRRSRRQREREMRLARRLIRGGHVAASEDR